MKLAEKWFQQDGRIIHQRTHDAEAPMKAARLLRDREDVLGKKAAAVIPESETIGVVPGWLWSEWIKEAGVSFDDHEGCRRVIERKLMDSDNNKLRVWGGTI